MRSSLKYQALTVMTIVVVGCDLVEPDSTLVTIVNQTSTELVLDVWEWEAAQTVDPNPTLEVAITDLPKVLPGDSLSVGDAEIKGEYSSGDDLRVFVWEVVGDSAHYRRVVDFTYDRIENSRGRVVISEPDHSVNPGLVSSRPDITILTIR